MVHAVSVTTVEAGGVPSPASTSSRTRKRGRGPLAPRPLTLLIFVAPALIFFLAMFGYPIVAALGNAFFAWSGTTRGDFLGLQNFAAIFTLQPYASQMFTALGNNLYFFVGTMILQNGVGLALAFLLNRTLAGKRFFQTVISVPYLMSALVVGYAWSMILSPHFGILNSLLGLIGIDGPVWLGDPDLIMPILIVINSWQWCGVPMLIFGAALSAIPHEQIEAARIDGASWWRTARSIQMPQLLPSFSIITVLTLIGSFNLFDLVYAIGGVSGGIGGAADVLGTLFFRISFSNDPNAIGLSGALSMVQLLLILAATVVTQRLFAGLARRYE
ncbi:carbohydrate ABC transporter permease [Microbacterium sp. A94]|uniref:carbohydrate ABC transporter permease n=1 Tax=Microbacterium sp. A94 TaxID=3450717 RepID=UPI003F41CDE6